MPKPNTAVLAIHYQNENCHPDGKIRVGIAADADWRWERLGNAKRLLDGARARGAVIIHVRLAVPPDYRGVSANTDLIREWMDLNAWQEDTWGTAFIQSLEPHADDFVITHTRNSAFYNTRLNEILFQLRIRNLICAGVSTAYAVEVPYAMLPTWLRSDRSSRRLFHSHPSSARKRFSRHEAAG